VQHCLVGSEMCIRDSPETEPELPVLWVVIPGGLDSSEFPFGEVVRLRGHPP
jgi:hypothetical protein